MVPVLSRHVINNGMVHFWLNTDAQDCPPAISLPLELILKIAEEAKQ